MKYKSLFKNRSGEATVIGVYDTMKQAIEACVDYRHGYYSLDTKEERRNGLEQRGWCIIGYSSDELSVEEVPS